MLQLMPWAMGNHSDLILCSGTDPNGNNARQQQPAAMNLLGDPVVYPNPLSQENAVLTLQLDAIAGAVQLTMHNSIGQLVMDKEEQVAEGQNTLQLDLAKLEPGVYVLNVNRNGQLTTHRVVIQ